MGQQSSQIAPEETASADRATPMEDKASIGSSMGDSDSSHSGSSEASVSRKRKTNVETPLAVAKKRKLGSAGEDLSPASGNKARPMPQSRRGTNIQPEGPIYDAASARTISASHDSKIEVPSTAPASLRTGHFTLTSPERPRKRNRRSLSPTKAQHWDVVNDTEDQKEETGTSEDEDDESKTPSDSEKSVDSVAASPVSTTSQSIIENTQPTALPSSTSSSRAKLKKTPPTHERENNATMNSEAQRGTTEKNGRDMAKTARRKPPRVRTTTRESLSRAGTFSAEEKALADEVFEEARQQAGITEDEFKRRIAQEWRTLAYFKERICLAFPNRTPKSLYKFCSRRYHTFDKGPWSSEDDEELKRLYRAHPDAWVQIGQLIGRSPQACRDRYRNYVKYNGSLELGHWTDEEIEKLQRIVSKAIKIVKKEYPDETDERALEDLINWEYVAEKMDGKRSRKRCMEKYRRIKEHEENGTTDSSPLEPHEESTDGLSKTENLLRRLGPGDIFDVLTEIADTFGEHDPVIRDEATVWLSVSRKHSNSRFSSKLRKHVYQGILQSYSDVPEVRRAETIPDKARCMAQILHDTQGGKSLKRKYHLDRNSATSKSISDARVSENSRRKSAELVDDD